MKIKRKFLFTRRIVLICLISISFSRIWADSPEYLFDEFKPALLISVDKRQYNAEVNYSFMYNAFVFKDTKDNDVIKVFDPVMGIRTVKIGEHIFLIEANGTTKEVLQQVPLISVRYKGKMKLEGKNVGYGGKSETSAVDSYSHLYSKSGGPVLELKTSEYQLMGVDKIYEIDRKGKAKTFMTPSRFVKLYPKQIQKVLTGYIDKQKINFDDPEQVIVLYNYAESLTRQ